MKNDYCVQSYTNNDQGERDGAKAGAIATTKAGAAKWFQKTRYYKVITNPMLWEDKFLKHYLAFGTTSPRQVPR